MSEGREPTREEQELYSAVKDALLETLDSFVEHPLLATVGDMQWSIVIDALFGAAAAIIAAAHAGHAPTDCSCEENAIRSLRYAIKTARAEFLASNPSQAQH